MASSVLTQNAINTDYPIEAAAGGTGNTSLNQSGVLIGQGTDPVNVTSAPEDGELLIGSTGNDPVVTTLTAGQGINISNTPGQIEISSTGELTWEIVTAATKQMDENVSYVANNATGVVEFTLPSTVALGSVFTLYANTDDGFRILQNTGQTIRVGKAITSAGSSGNIQSKTIGDVVRVVCTVADTEFAVVSMIGNLQIDAP